MFTGLVQERGIVTTIVRQETSAQITIKAPLLAPQIKTGDSVSVDGVCLTATAVTADSFTADAMVQTLAITSLGKIDQGSEVNLELAARLDARMGGHIVQGHVDGTGTLVALTPGEQWMKCEVKVDKALLKYIVAKGSICFSGISLTVGEVNDETSVVTVWLIPETLERTTIGKKKAGDVINIEVDVLAKYVERMMEKK
ncbi:MAG: riboflavin synthase [Actinobacteria bacterium]|nr:riboflavin synthase [Actinomycetota bacterium]